MRTITFGQATLEAMSEEMKKDPTVFVMGEDLARQGGIFGQFAGLADEFPGRVIDTPISETFLAGGGVGAALAGARPVVDLHYADFAVYVWMRYLTRWQRQDICQVDRLRFRWCSEHRMD